MADVFISYARSDKARVAPLVAAIEAKGWSVWWDPDIAPGQEFDRLIASELEIAAAVLVVWTPKSVDSRWVRGEAREGAERGILVPVRFERAHLPIDVRAFHTTDLDDTKIDAQSPQVQEVLRALGTVIARRHAADSPTANHRSAPPTPVDHSARSRWTTRRIARYAIPAVLLLSGLAYFWWGRQTEGTIEQARAPQTIAVLPFDNLSGDASYDYLGEGLSEELLHRLAGVPGLQVSARTSSAHFGGKHGDTIQAIGKALGVAYVVEGSVRKSGDALRVTAQLIDSGTGFHVWSRTFDRTFADVLAIQEEISLAILAGLDVPIIQKSRAAVMSHATSSPQALDLYLQARKLDQRWEAATNERAIAYYERAIALDPGFAAAHLRLADAIASRGQAAPEKVRESDDAVIEQHIRKAIELDPYSADAHAFLARWLLIRFDMEGMKREIRAAEDLNPNSELALYHLAQLYGFVGWPPEKAIDYAEQWVRIDPLNPWAACNVALAQQYAFRFGDALRTMDGVIKRDPDFWVAHFVRTWQLLELGRNEDALVSARKAFELHPSDETRGDLAVIHARKGDTERARELLSENRHLGGTKFDPPYEARVALALGDLESAMSAVERSYAQGDVFIFDVLLSPDMVPLHGRPEFQQIVKRLGLERRVAYTAEHARNRRK